MLDDVPTLRARIGLIIPASNRLTEPQMRRYAPPGVEIHVTRLRMTGAQHVPLAELGPRVVEAALALADAQCDVIVFHCTAASMEAGLAGDRQMVETIERTTGRRGASTATAVLAALRALDLRRIALISPYVAETHRHEVAFLTEAGITVSSGEALGLAGGDEYLSVPPRRWLELAQRHAGPATDGVFLSCTNIHAVEVIQPGETLLLRPVVASNQAVLWYALRQCGIDDVVLELGRLLQYRLPVVLAT